jgi:hypothetical protein
MLVRIRLIVNRILFYRILSPLVFIALISIPLLALAEEDICREIGISIGNQTMLDLWYTRNGGACSILPRGHIITIKLEDTLMFYKDRICETEYCSDNPSYDYYKYIDADQNCRVRILPGCNVSDM